MILCAIKYSYLLTYLLNPQKSFHKKFCVYIWLFWQTSITNSTKGTLGTTAKYGNLKPNEPTVHYILLNIFIHQEIR